MKSLPEKGLIVSCYLASMSGCEKEFISSVAHVPGVVALRVEGLDNIKFARMIAPEAFIIGLVKVRNGAGLLITPTDKDVQAVFSCGANMVASYRPWTNVPLMLDCAVVPTGDKDVLANLSKRTDLILATTFAQKGFRLVRLMKQVFPGLPVNLEGGIETAEEVREGFAAGADYVTIGKAINDPPTIIRRLLEVKSG